MRTRLLTVFIILGFMSSCGEYQQLLKSSDYNLKKDKAKEYYDEGRYVRTTELLMQIMPRFRASQESEALEWMNAMAFYGMRDYITAGSYFKSYTDQYGYGEHIEEAYFMAALCDYHLSPKPELDQSYTRSAIEGFTYSLNRYPDNPSADECRRYIRECEEKLTEKSYMSARLYYDMTEYKAAVVALTNNLKDHTDSKYREEMMFLRLSSLFLYAENSMASRQTERYQETLDDYYSFVEEFPDSRFIKDARRIYVSTSRALNLDPVVDEELADKSEITKK